MSRALTIYLVILAGALAAAPFAPAKGDLHVRLTKPLPLGAAPGTTIRVAWSVDRPNEAAGMLVRLLSRTGARASTAYVHGGYGRYQANVRVPAGGIGGIRIGSSHSPDVLFPIANDPFTSPGGGRCDVVAVRSTLTAFVRAYNAGDLAKLDRLFSRERFVWYFATGPDRRLRETKQNRATLIPYFRRRHASGDRLALGDFRFNGYDRARERGHFQWSGRRRADDIHAGLWMAAGGKGALDCKQPPITLSLLLVGS